VLTIAIQCRGAFSLQEEKILTLAAQKNAASRSLLVKIAAFGILIAKEKEQ
jgi:hypothetical protein